MIDVETIFDSDREEYEFMQEKKEQPINVYDDLITKINIAMQGLWRHGETGDLVVILSRDVFTLLQIYATGTNTINYEHQTICGCNVKFVDGTEQLYVSTNLFNRRSR